MSGKTAEVRLCVCFSSGVEGRWVVVTELKPLFPAHCSLFHNFKDDNLLIGCGEVELSVFWLLSLVEIDVFFFVVLFQRGCRSLLLHRVRCLVQSPNRHHSWNRHEWCPYGLSLWQPTWHKKRCVKGKSFINQKENPWSIRVLSFFLV